MRCTKCNALLDVDSVFCPNCGANVEEMRAEADILSQDTIVVMDAPAKLFCHQCGTEYEEGDEFCGGCGRNLKAMSVVAVDSPANQKAYKEKSGKAKVKKGLKQPSFLKKINVGKIAGIVAVAAVVVLGVIFIPKLFSGKNDAKGQLYYLKDNEIFKNKGKNNVSIADDVFEDEDEMDYIYADFRLSEDGKTLFYPQNVAGSRFDLYFKKGESEKDKGTKIDSDVYVYSLLGDNRVIYRKGDSGEKLYISDLKGNKEKVASDVSTYYISKDEKTILYTVRDDGEYKLYMTDAALKKTTEKLDSGISNMIAVSEDMKNIYYMKDDSLYVCKNFKDTEKISSDVIECYVSRDDNKKVHLYYLVDKDEDDYIAISKYLNEDVDSDSYEAQDIKNWIESELCNFKSRKLYYYTEGYESMLLAEGNIRCDMQSGGSFSYEVATGNSDKKMKLSKLLEMDYEERNAEIQYARAKSSVHRINVFGKDITIESDDDKHIHGASGYSYYNKNSNTVYLIMTNPKNVGDKALVSVNMSGDGKTVEVCDDFYGNVCFAGKTVYYLADYNEKHSTCDMYADGEKIDSDVNSIYSAADEKSVLYYKDRKNGEGTLCKVNGTKIEEISDDVYTHDDSKNGDIAILCDYDTKDYEGDLMLYHNGKLQKVDSDVAGMLMMD